MHNDPEVEKKQGWITVGDLEGCVHYKVGKDLNLPAVFRVSVGNYRSGQVGSRNVLSESFLFLIFLVKYERIKFLVIALKNSVEIYAWAPKPYHKFMAFKVRRRM